MNDKHNEKGRVRVKHYPIQNSYSDVAIGTKLSLEEFKSARYELIKGKVLMHQVLALSLTAAGIAFSLFGTDVFSVINSSLASKVLLMFASLQFMLGAIYVAYFRDFINISAFLREYAMDRAAHLKAFEQKFSKPPLTWAAYNRAKYQTKWEKLALRYTWSMQVFMPVILGIGFIIFSWVMNGLPDSILSRALFITTILLGIGNIFAAITTILYVSQELRE